MVTIDGFGAAMIGRLSQTGATQPKVSTQKQKAPAPELPQLVLPGQGKTQSPETQQLLGISQTGSGKPEHQSSQSEGKQLTPSEFAEVLHRVNLTSDLFEVQAKFMIDPTGDISIQITNQRTGEVIRKIPPYEVQKIAQAISNGAGGSDPIGSLLTDIKA